MSHHNRHNKPTEAAAPKTTTPPPAQDATDLVPNVASIRTRAYEICQNRNGGPGDALTDWTQAEKELKTPRVAKF
ncbi:MAG: DUF2934 domain-containing protein [Planctomycetes bacterium]|nr:DUF2934 domain-containing protein [Planctomycetota bacterium]